MYRKGIWARLSLSLVLLGAAMAPHGVHAEQIAICDAPAKLPGATGLGDYSPPICFAYSGLQPGESYVLRVWLLAPPTFPCASTQWCERTFMLMKAKSCMRPGYTRRPEPG